MSPERSPLDSQYDAHDEISESTSTTPVSRRGWGKHVLLSASALAVLFASSKPAEVQAAPPTDTWKLGGNAGVDSTNYIGPTNSAPLIIKTGGLERMRVTASGNVGIGNASPTAKLLVDVANGVAIYARHTATSGDAPAVRGETAATVANASGVMGQITTTTGASGMAGVWGDNKATNNNGSGVRGTHASGGYGVYGQAGAGGYGVYATGGYTGVYSAGDIYGMIVYGTGTNSYGVYGSGQQIGLYGLATTYGVYGSGGTGVHGTSTTGTGVFGTSTASNGVFGSTTLSGDAAGVWGSGAKFGVIGRATATTGENYGVFGKSASPAGFAGYFEGPVAVTGTLSKPAGSFKIDHPVDPENKYLYHSFVESPDMMNVYNGNVVTDGKGDATVTLPTYFEALNRDFRYQLTPIGQLAQAAVINEIKGNQFTVKTDKPNVKLSWQVTGIRKDAFANANRIPIEVQKPASERGRYLHPGAFGKPASQNITVNPTLQAAPQGTPDQPQPVAPDAMRR